ncbi:oxygenase MpaB family protein [Patulibacter brassicae]|jgi:uncharacterized protein (DUF2236 family)|uniref:Oxygenase MpaB family protein n=1 Tax=Patulibacter brassicae TaxID=1705717 RepID=A0ABU4VJ39_9ACTN|nr:oxygenase MpaB family protein [Patulibacter brassicae]MDX8151813.1 oxygenase MpaB family protein [Patulibacter brassicae]
MSSSPRSAATWALGPGAVSWKVLRNPAVFVVALLREGLLLTLHPPFAAAAVDHDRVHQDPVARYRTIARYAYSTVYGTPAEAERVAGFVRRNHVRVVGIEPVSGAPYQAHSQYELSLTQALLTDSWIASYELLVGPLADAERDGFVAEQRVAGALLGVPPEHLPATAAQLQRYIAVARRRWAAGDQAREILRPFTMGEYPAGSVIGELPPLRRLLVGRAIRGLTDVALLTMDPADRELLSLPRRPELRSPRAVRASARLLAAGLGSPRGVAAWERFMKADVAAIVRRARDAEHRAGGHERAARTFACPDPSAFVAPIDDLVANWRPEVLAD